MSDVNNPTSSDEIDHDQISGVSASDHHTRPSGGSGLSFDSTNNQYDALLGNALGIDANGNIYVKEGGISHDSIAGVSASDHHTRPTGTGGPGTTQRTKRFTLNLGTNTTKTRPWGFYTDTIDCVNTESYISIIAELIDGTTVSASGGSSATVNGYVHRLKFKNSDNSYSLSGVDFDVYATPGGPHTHSI